MVGKKQFDVDVALDAAMVQFWRAGYADTSLDDLSRATGLNRSSIYSSFGDKDALYLRCLDRYATRYGARYDQALSVASEEPLRAVREFFDVTLRRIADPEVPDGCLIAQTTMAIPALSPVIAARAVEALAAQQDRLRNALTGTESLTGDAAGEFAVHLAAVNQSLAVMSRAGASRQQLRTIIDVSLNALEQALRS